MSFIKNVFLNFNTFPTTQFFRFNGDYEYTNIMGGIFTFLIRSLLLTMLIVQLMTVFKYSQVKVTSNTNYSIDVLETQITPVDAESPFLFAVQLLKSSGNRSYNSYKSDLIVWTVNSSQISTYLQVCTKKHWAAAPKQYNILRQSISPDSQIYCLPVNFKHKLSIAQQATFSINFGFNCRMACSAANYSNFMIRPIYYNRLINPQNNTQYLTSFLDKRLYYTIDTTDVYDTILSYTLSKYQINTDNSLLPFESVSTEKGILMSAQPIISYHPNRYTSFIFVRSVIMLSNQEFVHYRKFAKILDAISLVGGLIPIFMISFLWLNYYALSHFEMTFIKRLHSDQRAKQYGLFYFLSKFVYSFLTLFNVDMSNWQQTKQFHKMHKVVNQLIDILYLHKRLDFMERAFGVLFQDHQLKVLHLMRNQTFKQAECTFNQYQMKDNLSKFVYKEQIRMKRKSSRASKTTQKQIILQPRTSMNALQSLNSDKHLHIVREFEGQVVQTLPRAPNETLHRQSSDEAKDKSKMIEKPIQEEESDIDQEVQKQQMNDLREAYRCYERLRYESEDENSDYYSLISRNILKRLDECDRQLLDDLQNLLNIAQKDELLNMICEELFSKKDFLGTENMLSPQKNQHNSKIKLQRRKSSLGEKREEYLKNRLSQSKEIHEQKGGPTYILDMMKQKKEKQYIQEVKEDQQFKI